MQNRGDTGGRWHDPNLSRRDALKLAVAAGGVGALAKDQAQIQVPRTKGSSALSRVEIREALIGPIPTISVPFHRDGNIDFDGLRNYVDFVLAARARSLVLTYGDSLYSILTDQEVSEVTKAVVEHTAGRAMIVAADRTWWTGKTIEFANYVRGIGVDVLMVLPPNWAASCTAETLAEHYAAVARKIPVMVVTNVFILRSIEFGLKTLTILKGLSDNVVAVKDDWMGPFGRRLGLLVSDEWAAVSVMKENYLDALHYGFVGYLSNFLEFRPEVAHRYWSAIKSQDWSTAVEMIRKYEIPFSDCISKLPGGADAGMHAAFELAGIYKRWRRKPYYSLNDQEMEALADFLKKLTLL